MNSDQILIDIQDYQPDALRRVKKSIFDNDSNQFIERTYCSVLTSHHHTAIAWLTERYGRSSYNQGVWWSTWDRVVMREDIYIFYLLSKNND